ncbi:MAG: hypothetical protein WC551_10530 [Patescibacteria group bacterium]
MLDFDPVKHIYRWNGVIVPGVTSIIGAAGLTCYDYVDPELMRITSEFGKEVHRVIELSNKGKLDVGSVDPLILPYLAAWKQFLSAYKPTILASEVICYHEQHRYAGTIDVVLGYAGKTIIVDIKTPKVEYPSWSIQTAAYSMIWFALTRNSVIPKSKRGRWTVQLIPENTVPYKVIDHDKKDGAMNDAPDFLHALGMYRCKQRLNLLKGDCNG